jgi:hypothetical protein
VRLDRMSPRAAGIFVLALIAFIAFVLLVGVLLSGLLGHRGFLPEGYGIAYTSGTTSVVVCDEQGISRAEIQDETGTVAWVATSDGQEDLRVLPVVPQVPGYSTKGAIAHPDSKHRLTRLEVAGRSVLVSTPTFVPSDIPDGSILTGDGELQSLEEFEVSTSGCEL